MPLVVAHADAARTVAARSARALVDVAGARGLAGVAGRARVARARAESAAAVAVRETRPRASTLLLLPGRREARAGARVNA